MEFFYIYILLFLEGSKRLLPENMKERIQMIGILNEIAGEGGLMYLNRLLTIDN